MSLYCKFTAKSYDDRMLIHQLAFDEVTCKSIVTPFEATLHVLRRCSSLLLQMSHVAWSVCLCVRHTGELCKNV